LTFLCQENAIHNQFWDFHIVITFIASWSHNVQMYVLCFREVFHLVYFWQYFHCLEPIYS